MNKRTIMIFPEFDNINIINSIRKKYDPLADFVLPHITLVFPFESNLTNEDLHAHLKRRLSDVHPFRIESEGFSKQQNDHGNLTLARAMSLI
ncbi:2'-5' RNA ligase family protein [Lachnospiraceae bacterium 54-53]